MSAGLSLDDPSLETIGFVLRVRAGQEEEYSAPA